MVWPEKASAMHSSRRSRSRSIEADQGASALENDIGPDVLLLENA